MIAERSDDRIITRARWRRRATCFAILTLAFLAVLGILWDRAIGNVSIRFYGRVVDTNGRGISGVMVPMRVTKVPFFSLPNVPWQPLETLSITTTTDSDGRFAVSSKGLLLEIVDIKAPGLALWNGGGGMVTGFVYARDRYGGRRDVHDDPSRPYVYLMVPADSPDAKWQMDRHYEMP
jgi:hypothetical protein